MNSCDGRKPKLLSNTEIKQDSGELVSRLRQDMSVLWTDVDQHVYIDQNVSTHIAYIVDMVSKNGKPISIFLDAHEVFWIKDILQRGELSLEDMSYPNYATKHQFTFQSHPVTVFDPDEGPMILEDEGIVVVVIHSHVSRLTGQEYPVESIFKHVKEKYPDAVCIADGAQMIGGSKIYPLHYTDAYIATSSKFIGAELHLGLCVLEKGFKYKYISEDCEYPQIDLGGYTKELFSTVEMLKQFNEVDFEKHIHDLRLYLVEQFKLNGLEKYIYEVPHQVNHIITLSVGDRDLTADVVKKLLDQYKISVSDNMGYSIVEPGIPLIRISLSISNSKKDIDTLVIACKELL